MPILKLADRRWEYLDVGILKKRFILHIQRDPARTTQPRVRAYTAAYGHYSTRGFEERVLWHRATTAEPGISDFWEYELLQDRNFACVEITTHTPFAGSFYFSVKRVGKTYDVREYTNAEACIRAFNDQSRFGDVRRVISEAVYAGDEADGLMLGQPGPRDRFERILDFGVKGADPEPEIEEVLDKVVVAPPRKRQEIPEGDLMEVLEQVEAPPERGRVDDDEFQKLLNSIK